MSELEPVEYETGTVILVIMTLLKLRKQRTVLTYSFDINLDSGYSLIGTMLEITNEDLAGYETKDIEEGIKLRRVSLVILCINEKKQKGVFVGFAFSPWKQENRPFAFFTK